MKRRLLAALLTCVMLFSLLPATALAEEGDVAQIGENTYATLDQAVAAAADGDTIELLADATTAGLNLSKDLTIQAAEGAARPTITFTQYGIALWGKALTFKDINVVMNGIGSTPYTAEWNWMTICASKDAALTLDNVTMTMDGDPEKTGTNMNKHAIYFCSNNKLNLKNGTVLTIQNYEQDALEWDGGDGGYNVNITDSTFISDHNRSGFTGTFYATIDKSTVEVTNSLGNGSNGTYYTIKNESHVLFDGNRNWGISAWRIDMTNKSTLTATNNGFSGIWTRVLNVDSTCTLDVEGNGTDPNGFTTNAGIFFQGNGSYTSTIEQGAKVTIKNNAGSGIYTAQSVCNLTIRSGTITNNGTGAVNQATGKGATYGGGVYNVGTMVLGDDVILYNNHADTAGDDIYNTGTISFGPVGDDWCLDGDPDCEDPIDGWYDDAEGDRWEAHNKANLHVVEFTQFGTQPTALKAAHGILPDPEPEPIVPEWETSKSKTATNLEKQSDGTYTSDVTLSLPAAEEPLVTDVVFVLDKSTSTTVVQEAQEMLERLKDAVAETGAKVKVGVVIFNKEDHRVLELTELNDTNMDRINKEIGNEDRIEGGTNTHAGLLAGKAMLDEDTSVSANRKYLIFVSDGITYIFDDEEGKATSIVSEQYYNEAGNVKSTPSLTMTGAAMKYPYGQNIFEGTTVSAYLERIGKLMENDQDTYWVSYDSEAEEATQTLKSNVNEVGVKTLDDEIFAQYVGDDSVYAHANNVDTALYLTDQVYQEAVSAGYHCYAVSKNNSTSSSYPWADTFMDYLANGEKVSFGEIENDIYYLLDAGSTVVDYMGYDTYGTNTYYDFDFVDSADKLVLKVGDAEYKTTKVESGLANGETARYVFNYSYVDENGETVEVKATNKAEAPFVLHYYAGEGKSEHFVWDINVPVSQFETVQLTYTVKLTNPETDIGTYGEYDEDGSKNKEALYTNNSATLYPIDSDGHKVESEDFPKPTVSYTVGETGTLTLTKYVLSSDAEAEDFTFEVTIGNAEPERVTVSVAANPETGIVSGSTEIPVPFGDTYTVEEVTNSDYTPKYLTEQSGTITPKNPTATVAVANVCKDEAALFISKTVSNGGSTTQKFTFTVELTDTNNEAVTGTLVYTGSDAVTTFESGETVTLTSGNSATIYGLPAGVKYKVTEASVSNYTTTYTVIGVDGTKTGNIAEGTITKGTVAGVHYTNTYTKPSTPSGGSSGGGGSTVLNTDDHYSYIIGYKDGYLRPYGTITRGEVATIFFRLLTDEARDKYWSQTNDYSDCNSDLWCNNAISTLSNMGIIDGYTDGTFRPYGKITRAQFAKIAVGFFETTKKEYQGYYSDVPENAWFTDYVEAASRVGLIQGFEDGTFRPNTNITRAQACVIVNRALNRKPDEDHLLPEKQMVTWPDNNPGDWYYADMQEATNSHDYTWLSKGSEKKYMEDWTKKLEQRDWAAFEHAWSTAHSAPGGEVVK